MVLWTVSLLSAFAVILGYQVRQRLTLAYRLDELMRLSLIAESGARQAMLAVVSGDEEPAVSSLGEAWSLDDGAFKDVGASGGTYSVVYEYWDPQEEALESWYGIMDEERKINLNVAQIPVLSRLLQSAAGMDETRALECAAAIADWRDEDSELALPNTGAEDSYYRGVSDGYEAKDAPFELVEELLLVKGVTPPVYERIRDYVTVYGDGRVNINTASAVVLTALGIDERLAGRIREYRIGADETAASSDDAVFEDVSSLTEQLSRAYALTAQEINQLNQLAPALSVSSRNFLIRCRAQSPNKKIRSTVTCVVDRAGTLHYWRQG